MPSKCIEFIDPKSILPVTYSRLNGIKLSSMQTLHPSDSALAAFEAISIVPDTNQLIIRGKYTPDESQPGHEAAVCNPDGGNSDAEDLDALRQELEFYSGRLHLYQGCIVPRLYGGYEGVLESWRATVTVICLILEDCGVPLTEDLPVKNFDILSQVMEKFLCLHKRAHVSLPDEALEGCLVWQPDSKDSIRVVGFGKAREHDDCRWTEPPHYSLDKYGSWSLFNCKDLYHLSGRIGWLTPGVVWVEGEEYDVTRYHSSEEIIAAPANSFRSNNPMFRRAVFRAVETYNELYGNRKETICQRYHLDEDNWPPKAVPLAEFDSDSELQNTTQMFGSGLHISESASGVNSQR